MKMLVHRTPVSASAPFVQAALKDYLRIDFDDEDGTVENVGWTAAHEIEQFAQIALLTQTIRVTVFGTVQTPGMNLPIGPLIDAATLTVTVDGEPYTDFQVVAGNRPYIRWSEGFYGLCPSRMTIEYQAGFGADPDDIPRDLAQALMDQAALHFDGRSPMDAKALTSSPHMARVGARYRGVQL